jgi:hypothetical protein
MRFAYTNNRRISQRARRDAEAEQREPRRGPPSIPHGTVIGSIVVTYHGQRVVAEILQAGDRARTHGVRIDGGATELMGLHRAAVRVASLVSRVPGKRSDFWDD